MYTPKEKGADVVKAVVDRITDLGIFPDDHKFMCRIAWVESKYGTDQGTYRPGYHGGIWQVSHYTRKTLAVATHIKTPCRSEMCGPRTSTRHAGRN